MQFSKIQTQCIQKMLSKKPQKFFVGEYEDKVGVHETHVLWLIPKSKFLLDINKMQAANVKQFFNNCTLFNAYKTGIVRTRGKTQCVQISDGKIECYVDEKLLRFFDDPIFGITGPKNAVYVYEDAELVGLVLPCIIPGVD